MLTRRENLLIRPWQERRYINHRNKVEHALPAIDVKSPPKRTHVACKLKKLQKEAERCARIEQDNFTLLQHLRSIMHSSRIDNVWQEAPPNFLQRVGIYCPMYGEHDEVKCFESFKPPTNRKERCFGCSPHRIEKKEKIPEERIPWDPPRPRLSRRRSGSLIITGKNAKKEITHSSTAIQEISSKKASSCPPTGNQSRKKSRNRSCNSAASTMMVQSRKMPKILKSKQLEDVGSQSIILSHGALKLAVNFPPYSTVVLKDRGKERVLQSEFCHCKAVNKTENIDPNNSA